MRDGDGQIVDLMWMCASSLEADSTENSDATEALELEPEPTANLPDCINGDCNCRDFISWQQAQDVLNAYPGDPHRLDADDDGEACENLR